MSIGNAMSLKKKQPTEYLPVKASMKVRRATKARLVPSQRGIQPSGTRTPRCLQCRNGSWSVTRQALLEQCGNDKENAKITQTDDDVEKFQVPEEPGQQETWHAIEDLWLRLRAQCPVIVIRSTDTFAVVFANFRDALWEGDMLAMRYRVMDPESYRWHEDGRRGEFARLIEYRGNDLVIQMASLSEIRRCHGGESMAWQVGAFLNRLEMIGGCSRA